MWDPRGTHNVRLPCRRSGLILQSSHRSLVRDYSLSPISSCLTLCANKHHPNIDIYMSLTLMLREPYIFKHRYIHVNNPHDAGTVYIQI